MFKISGIQGITNFKQSVYEISLYGFGLCLLKLLTDFVLAQVSKSKHALPDNGVR